MTDVTPPPSGEQGDILAAWEVELRADLVRARDIAALLESELAAGVVPQVLTSQTPEPNEGASIVAVDGSATYRCSLFARWWQQVGGQFDFNWFYFTWSEVVDRIGIGTVVYVISAHAGDDRG